MKAKYEIDFHQILDAMTDLVLVKGEKSKIVWANQAFCNYYGMTNEQLKGIIDAPFNEPDYTQQYIKDDAYVFETGKVLVISEEVVTRHDGYAGIFQTVKSPIVDQQGKTIMTVGISREITLFVEANRKRETAEAEVLKQTEEIKQANLKLTTANEQLKAVDLAKTKFFANISHEFRTPLTLMLGPLEDSLSDQVLPLLPEQRSRQELAYHNALRLLKLVNSLLDFSRIEEGRMQAVFEPTDLGKVTRELASHFESTMKRAGLRFSVTTEPIHEQVFVDREMWEKIVLNLLSNAFKFTLKGEVQLNIKQEGHFAVLAVKDTGVGIPEHEQKNIFQRFYRIENSRGRTFEGTGIGLALIQELVKMHGGTISVSSKIDEGSTFVIKIPLGSAHLPIKQVGGVREVSLSESRTDLFVEEALRYLPAEIGVQKLPVSGQVLPEVPAGRILLADDNADMRAYVEALLKPYWQVTSVSDGQEAYEEALQNKYDLILSDVMMPRLDGFALLRKLRENPTTKTIAVILISARAGAEASVVGVLSGADDYLIKPFSGKELVARVKTHLELQHLREERFKLGEEQLKLALESAQLGAWDWDLITNQVHRDAVTQKLYGYLPGGFPEILEAFEQLLHPDDQKRTLNLISDSFKNHTAYNTEFRVVWPDKSVHWIQSMGRALYDNNGKPYRALGIVLDITQRKKDEEILKNAIKARDEFITIASHELKTPITSLKMHLQLARRGIKPELGVAPPPEQLARTIDISTTQVDRLTKLIEDMLDVSRMENGKLSLNLGKVDLALVVREVLNELASELATAKCLVEVDAPEGVIGNWDRDRIKQVVINLVTNAMKYAAGSKININLTQSESSVSLKVQDLGPGIPKEKQRLIFQRFERATPYYNISGLGLGLYICKQIVEAHGGTIQVMSEVGHGAAFVIVLPLNFSSNSKHGGIS